MHENGKGYLVPFPPFCSIKKILCLIALNFKYEEDPAAARVHITCVHCYRV